jgi:hypothetical protein
MLWIKPISRILLCPENVARQWIELVGGPHSGTKAREMFPFHNRFSKNAPRGVAI